MLVTICKIHNLFMTSWPWLFRDIMFLPDSNCQGHIGHSGLTRQRGGYRSSQAEEKQSIRLVHCLGGFTLNIQRREDNGMPAMDLDTCFALEVGFYNIWFILDLANFHCSSTSSRYRTMILLQAVNCPNPDSVLNSHALHCLKTETRGASTLCLDQSWPL